MIDVAWLLFKILDWFDRGPQPSNGVVDKIKKDDDSERVDIYGRIRDSSHTPIRMSANHETSKHDRVEHENKKDSKQT
tara:strand:+ start:199 stop:432 length:234 start_codon:yes stop_codon:yes gene_type:complete